jgi:(p)ppGpp synthase/HD superfamily hydrolase
MKKLSKQYEDAIELVRERFDGKFDKGGHAYVGHLFRIAGTISTKIIDDLLLRDEQSDGTPFYSKARIVALLHDILEDTDTTVDELRELEFDEDIIQSVIAITRRKDETSYYDYIERVKKDDLARCVKIFDLEDNMDIKRLTSLEDKDLKRISKYWHCWRYLRGFDQELIRP